MATKLNLFLQKKSTNKIKTKTKAAAAAGATTTKQRDGAAAGTDSLAGRAVAFLLDLVVSVSLCVSVCACAKFMLLFASLLLRSDCAALIMGLFLLLLL